MDVSHFTADEAFEELKINYINKPLVRFKRKQYNDYMDILINIIEKSNDIKYPLTVALLYPQYTPQMFNCLYNAYLNPKASEHIIALAWLDKIKYSKNTELKKLIIARHDDKTIAVARSSPDLSNFCDNFYEDLTPEEQLGVII